MYKTEFGDNIIFPRKFHKFLRSIPQLHICSYISASFAADALCFTLFFGIFSLEIVFLLIVNYKSKTTRIIQSVY